MIRVSGAKEAYELAYKKALEIDSTSTRSGDYILMHSKGFVVEVSRSSGKPFASTHNGRISFGMVFKRVANAPKSFCLSKNWPEAKFELESTEEWVNHGSQKNRYHNVIISEGKIIESGYMNFVKLEKGERRKMSECVTSASRSGDDLSSWLGD